MSIKITGYLIVKAKVDGKHKKIKIKPSDFILEEDGWRNIGDDDDQYDALYIYHHDDYEEDFEISFQAVNFKGDVKKYEYEISGDIEIIEDELSIEATSSEDNDF